MVDKNSLRYAFLIIAGTVLILCGSFFLSEMKRALIYQRSIPIEGQKAPWLGSWQALIAAFICFGAGFPILWAVIGELKNSRD
ncbi:MAG TPA: hypothetical protein VIU85_08305 [Chthoniobacterales bacterium]